MRRALLVGIDKYDSEKLPSMTGCVSDAIAMRDMLQVNEDGSPNYSCKLLVSSAGERVTSKAMRSHLHKLFDDYSGDILFYFSGQGALVRGSGVLATQEGVPEDLGLSMDELVAIVNGSNARSALIIIDCCNTLHPTDLDSGVAEQGQFPLREGRTILAAASSAEQAFESAGHGSFTRLVLAAISGGAADILGRVSAASIYGYVEQFLGYWGQRPMYSSHADRLPPVRLCRPVLPEALLRDLPSLFSKPESIFRIDSSYEFTSPEAEPRKVAIFDKFRMFRNAGLVETVEGEDLYFAAMKAGRVRLTLLGQLYWKLAEMRRI